MQSSSSGQVIKVNLLVYASLAVEIVSILYVDLCLYLGNTLSNFITVLQAANTMQQSYRSNDKYRQSVEHCMMLPMSHLCLVVHKQMPLKKCNKRKISSLGLPVHLQATSCQFKPT